MTRKAIEPARLLNSAAKVLFRLGVDKFWTTAIFKSYFKQIFCTKTVSFINNWYTCFLCCCLL